MVRPRSFSLVVLCLFVSFRAAAATHVWTGAIDDHFSNASNWIGGSPAGDAAAEISFPSSSRLLAANDLIGLTVQSIAFSAGGFTLGGNAITLASNATIIDTSLGANTISCDLVLAGGEVGVSVANSNSDVKSLTLSGAISGAGGLSLRNAGFLTLSGSQPNTYSGLTRVLYGQLLLKKPANVTAVAGDLSVITTGNLYEYGSLRIYNDEQIAKTSHVTIGSYANLRCGATQTLGPVTLMRGADIGAYLPSTPSQQGTVIFASDIEITGTAQADVYSSGTFLLQGIRTINATASYGLWSNFNGPGQKTAGSGIILIAPYVDGAFDVLDFRQATYDGPTTIKGGSVRLDAPKSAVDVQSGRYSGHCKSLTAEGGVINLHNYLGGVTSDSDVKLSPAVTAALDVGATMKMNGTLDLGGATLRIDTPSDYHYRTVYKVVDNTSANPVIGTFASLPEGSTVANRYKISYVGGDGNDVTLTDFGLIPSSVSLTVSPYYPQTGTPIDFSARVSTYPLAPTGTVAFSAGTTALGTVPLNNGVAALTGVSSLPRGQYTVTAAYSGDSRVAPSATTSILYVVAVAPTLTSIDPSSITAGVKTTLTLHGTNFIDGSTVLFSSNGYVTTFVSSTELRIDFTPFPSESDYQLDVWVRQPDPYGAQDSGHLKLNVTGVPKTASPSPFTFNSDKTTTLTGITPGAMTFWLAVARTGGYLYFIDAITSDSDHDGTVTFPFPYNVTTLPPYGLWAVADLSAHSIVFDNPSRTAPAKSPFPSKAFLRDANGNYTHVQFVASSYVPSMFAWARAGVGAWVITMGDYAPFDEDGGPNGRVAFETSSMQRAVGTTAPPPADGIKPGDMFMAVDGYGTQWWGDAVDGHLSESDGAGKLGFAVGSSNPSENSGTAKILVERTEGSDGTVTVQYATANDTAIAGKNYVAEAGTLTFGPGEIFKTISVPLIDDQTYTGGSQFVINLSNPAGASIGFFATHTVRIADAEQVPTLSIVLPSSSVQEGDNGKVEIPITVKLTGATLLPVTVNAYWFEGEYTSVSNGSVLQFAPGETQKTFIVSYMANTTPEPDRILSMHLWNATNATASSDPLTLTIVDDDFAGVSVADASVVENAGKVIVPLQLSRSSSKPVTVTYETRNGTALAGSDYTATSGTVTVTGGSSITIPILDDAVAEPIKAFEVVLTSVSGGKLDRATAAITIVDDDSPTAQAVINLSPTVTVMQEGDSGSHDIPVDVTITGVTQQTVSVSYSWSENGGAAHTGTLQFAPGEARKSFNVSYTANTTPEPDRRIDIKLLNPSGATIAVANATITIPDDDYATVSVEDVTVMKSAGVASVPFVLSQVSMKPVTVYYTTAGTGTAADGVDFIAKSGKFTFEPGTMRMTVDVPIINDSLVEAARTFGMTYTAVEGGRPGRLMATVTILDDDSAPPPSTAPHRRSARH
jgi:hypothetical protein